MGYDLIVPNSAGVRSEFSRKYIGTTPVLVILGMLGMTLPALIQSPTWLMAAVSGSIVLIALAIWLSMLKTITVLSDGMEVKRTFLPLSSVSIGSRSSTIRK